MKLKFLIGCYTDGANEKGLHLLALDEDKSSINLVRSHAIANASFLTLSEDQSIIYTVNENHGYLDSLTAVAFDREKLSFETINKVDVKGCDPCFISTDWKRSFVFSANYSDGTLSCATINSNGSLGNVVQVIKQKQDVSDCSHPNTHMHAAVLCPDEKFLLTANLGQDTITIYPFMPELKTAPLMENEKRIFRLPRGTGPRHLVFDNKGSYVYVVGELDGSLHVLRWDNGSLISVQRLMLMPSDFDGKNSAAELRFGKDGKFLYVSNRGDANQIISFLIDQESGFCTLIERVSSQGIGPRNFAIDQTGTLMIVANQQSNNICIFSIDPLNGKLKYTQITYQLYSPVYVAVL